MYDHGFSVLEQYGIAVDAVTKARGGLVVKSEQGLFILREVHTSEKRIQTQQNLLKSLIEKGFNVDYYLENNQGNIISQDQDEVSYTLQKWYDWKECDTRLKEDIIRSVSLLANLHLNMKITGLTQVKKESLYEEFERHNKEMRKIQKFIRKKGTDNEFEKIFISNSQFFIDKGEEAISLLKQSSYQILFTESVQMGLTCHGEYNHHNILNSNSDMAIINFNHCHYNIQIYDLYCFIRKIMEKYNWDLKLAKEMVESYTKIKTLSDKEVKILNIMFCYPEKFWKLANYYITHKKIWISEKNIEKLKKVVEQKERWEQFVI